MSCRYLILFLISRPFLPFLQNLCLLVQKPKGLSHLCLHGVDCLPGQDAWADSQGPQDLPLGTHSFISEIDLNSSSLIAFSGVKSWI